MPVTAYIALGSNLGDRAAYLERAVEALRNHPAVGVSQVSSIFETTPIGGPPGQNDFLNAVAEVQTNLGARELLQVLLDIEQELGRVRQERHGPRTIDLDLLLYGDQVLNEDGLEVPHPRMHLRSFVLEPFAEIAPDVVHRKLGVTIGKLWDEFDPEEVPPEAPVPESETVPPVGGQALLGLRVVVTGSTSGIGRAIALAMARNGASVIIHGREERAAEDVANLVQALGVETGVLLADLSDLGQCRDLVENAWADWGPLDVWVNNAGVDILTGEIARKSFASKLRVLLDVDVMAALLMARDVGRRMREQGRGSILNMGWDQAETGMGGDSGELFAASKAAVMAFTKSLALSLAPHVRVNCLAPGWIRTAWGEGASDSWQRRVLRETPLGRWGKPEDVAATACWLASPAAAFITGQVIRINGGAVR
jgi:2-amino-4-hydroxy-6-hydroxymethyldihydropteridine diphosphokinase